MMNSATPLTGEFSNDAELVQASIAGNRDAFAHIVTRYQSLVCSLAYSATGSLSQSEDLAQETFLAAWKQMPALREPGKLRAWLCGIARNLINNAQRRHRREPSHQAATLEEISEAAAAEPLPAEQSITNEEQAILWRSLEQIPELYREPLVLFYREHQSVEAVAKALELTEDTVKQRMSRGRKLLHEQVIGFIESALEKTSPGKTFTLSVLAALPLAVTSAKAVTVGTALATGGVAAKGAASASIIGGLLVFFGSLYYSLRGQMDETKSPRERRFVLLMMGARMVFSLVCLAVYFSLITYAPAHRFSRLYTFNTDVGLAAIVFVVCCVAVGFSEFTTERRRKIQVEDGTFVGEEWTVARKAGGNADTSRTSYFRSARFKAMILMIIAMLLMMKMWTWGIAEITGLLVVWGLLWYLDFARWQNNPRFTYQGRDFALMMPVVYGLMTAAIFGLGLWNHASNPAEFSGKICSPANVAFNLGVVTAYGLLILFILRRRKRNIRVFKAHING